MKLGITVSLFFLIVINANAQYLKNNFTKGYNNGDKLVKGEYQSNFDPILIDQWNSFGRDVKDTSYITDNTSFRIRPIVVKAEFDVGLAPGDAEQYMLSFGYSESDPNRIYSGQDMGGVWVSTDAGNNWNNLRNRGLYSRYITSLEVDPLDKNRVLVVAQARTDQTHANYQGIYQTKNGGITWARVIARSSLGEIRNSTKQVAYAPSTKDSVLGYATRWYAALGEFSSSTATTNEDGGTDSDDGFFYSDNGGSNWNEVRKLPSDTFGNKINGIKVHPLNPDVAYMYGYEGLFRWNDATNSSGTFDRLSGSNGLPEGTIYGDIYISPDGETLILAVAGIGIYKSSNGGDQWASVYLWQDIQKCFVNPNYPDRIYATSIRSSYKQLRVSKNGGSTWNTNVNSIAKTGYSGNWQTRITGDMAWIIPDPRDPDKAFAHGNARHLRTSDGGSTWYNSSDYFNGSMLVLTDQMFDPVNADRYCYFLHDRAVWYTENSGQWFKSLNAGSVGGLTHTTCTGGAIHPVTSSGIILVGLGRASGQLVRTTDNGASWTKVRGTDERRWYITFDQQEPNYCYQWRERSSDAGTTWEELPMPENTIIFGMSFSDGKILYAIDVMGDKKNVYRSNDRGDTWETVISTSWDLTSPSDRHAVFCVHPQNPNIVYTKSPTGQITKWDLDLPTDQQQTDFDVFNGNGYEEGFYASSFKIDRRYPDVMYIMNSRDNTGNKLFRSIDGGVTWENLSEGFPNEATKGISVSPVTGEVFISSGNGTRVLLPPYVTAGTSFELIEYKNNYIGEPY